MYIKMPKLSHVVLTAFFLLSSVYIVSTLFMNQNSDDNIKSHSVFKDTHSFQNKSAKADWNNTNITSSQQSKNNLKVTQGLPLVLSLVYVSPLVDADDTNRYVVIIKENKNENDEQEFMLGDSVYLDEIQLTHIQDDSVEVTFSGDSFTLALDHTWREQATAHARAHRTFEQYLAMTPEQINTRPKVLEHIFDLTPTRLLPEGMLVAAGINEKLFVQAGFQDDDILLSVNGMDVEMDYSEIQSLLPSARMLTFDVIRKGKRITLYLDIPDEELGIVR